MPKITVLIKPNGAMEVDVAGVKGKGCKDITKFIEQMATVESTTEKPEFYETPLQAKNTIKN